MYSKVVNVAASTGGGTQDITFTPNSGDPSWTPKIAIFQWNRAVNQTSAWTDNQCYGIGFTDGTNQRCACVVSEDNQTDSDVASIASDTTLITTLTPTGTVETVDCTATFNSWLTNGIRISWSDAPAAPFYLTVLFLGGDDITNTTVGSITTPTGTGNFSITSLAYKPDFGIFLYPNVGSLDTAYQYGLMCIGAATSASNQWCQALYAQDAQATTVTRQYYSHSNIAVQGTTSVTGLVDLVSFNNDGFTLNASQDFGAAQPIFYLTMKGGYYAVGNETEPAGTGNQTITTGIGTKAVGVFGLDTGTADAFQTDLVWSGGFADNGINQYGHVWHDTNGALDTTVVSALDGAAHIYNNITANAITNNTVWDDSAIVSAMSASGFTLNWDNVGNARPFRWFAFGEAPPAEPSGIVSKVVTVAASTGGGNQNITFTADPAWVPKAAILQWSRHAIVDDTFQDGFSFGYGFTDGTNSRCVAGVSEDAVTNSDTARAQFNNAVLVALNPSGTITTVDAQASFVGWLSNGMTINWSNAPGSIMPITVTFLGGSALTNVTVGTVMSTVGSSCSATGLGYQPEWGMFLHTGIATENAGSSSAPLTISLGAVDIDENQWCQTWNHQDGSGTDAAKQYYSHSRCITSIAGAALSGYSVFESWDSGGFTISHPDTYSNDSPIYYIVGKGGEVKVGNSTEPGSTGQQTITTNTDVKSVIIVGNNIGSADTISNGGMWTSGMGDSTLTDKCISAAELWASDPMVTVSRYDTDAIYVNVTPNTTASSSTIDDEASLYGVSSSGFTLDWSNIGQARPFRFITFGGVGATPISTTKTHKYHITGLITASRTHKYNVIGKVSNSKTHKWIISIAVTTSKTHKYDIFKIVALTKTHAWNTIAKVLSTKTHLFNLLNSVSISKTHLYHLVNTVSTNKTHLYHIVNSVSTTKTHLYNVEGKVTASKTHLYDVQAPVSQVSTTKTHKYHLLNAVSTTKTHLYNIISKVTATKTHLYNVLAPVTTTKTHLYNILNVVSSSKTHKYNVIESVTTSKTHKYNLSGVVSTTKTHKYNLAGVVSTTKTHKYNILHKVTCIEKIHVYNVSNITITPTKTHKYNIINSVTTTKTHLYNIVSGSVTSTHTHKYNILETVSTTKTHIYSVVVSVSPAAEKTHLYDVIERIDRTQTHKYNILHTLTSQKTHLYDVVASVSTTKTHKYNVSEGLEPVSTTKTHIYNVLEQVETSKTHLYNLAGAVSTTKTHLYNVFEVVSTTKTHKYTLLNTVSTTKTHLYDVIEKVTTSKTHKYNLSGVVSTTKTHVYNVLGVITEVSTTKTHIYSIIAPVTTSKTHIYNIVNAISTTKTHKYNLIGKVVAPKTHLYDVEKLVSTSKTHVYSLLESTGVASKTHKYHIRIGVTTTKTHKYNTIGRITRTHTHRWNSGGIVRLTKKHIYDLGEAFEIPIGAGSSTVAHIRFPERVSILDIISNINNKVVANIELRPFGPKIICVGVVEINEAQISPIVRTASGKARHRIVSTLIIPPIIDTIHNRAVSGRIGIEEIVPKQLELKTLSKLALTENLQNIHVEGQTQIKEDPRDVIRLSSTTEILPRAQTRISSIANLQMFEFLNNIQFTSDNIMTREYEQTVRTLIEILKNDEIFK